MRAREKLALARAASGLHAVIVLQAKRARIPERTAADRLRGSPRKRQTRERVANDSIFGIFRIFREMRSALIRLSRDTYI